MQTIKIYALRDPFTHQVMYVGITSKSLTERLGQHIYRALRKRGKRGKTPRDRWIKKLAQQGASPVIEMVEAVTGSLEDGHEREVYWIKYYKTYGSKLTNATIGGLGVRRK